MQAGTREGGMQLVLKFLFDEDTKALVASPTFLVYRFREFICTLIGIIMVAGTRRNKRAIAEAEKRDHELQEAYDNEHAQDGENIENNSEQPVESVEENADNANIESSKEINIEEEKDIDNNQ